MAEDKLQRIIETRLRLRERFLERTKQTPGRSDDAPMGEGPANRHGMPQLPPEQTASKKWPVLDLGVHPDVPTGDWRLFVDGAVEQKVELDWGAFMALPQVQDESDFHCVTGWSKLDNHWGGVQLATVLALAQPRPAAAHVLFHAYDGYTTNIPMEEALKDDVLLVHTWEGAPLPREHGGPVRVITPQLWAWKGAKWIRRIEVLEQDAPGFWERRGYSNTAHPWRNDRYG